ncbi:hypothetical protein FHR71_005492 [Methylobacterium sp. RAS18]|nr:hypothetical protein [Methylobacterium sp. RAS18]
MQGHLANKPKLHQRASIMRPAVDVGFHPAPHPADPGIQTQADDQRQQIANGEPSDAKAVPTLEISAFGKASSNPQKRRRRLRGSGA